MPSGAVGVLLQNQPVAFASAAFPGGKVDQSINPTMEEIHKQLLEQNKPGDYSGIDLNHPALGKGNGTDDHARNTTVAPSNHRNHNNAMVCPETDGNEPALKLKKQLNIAFEPGFKRQRMAEDGPESSSSPDEDVDAKQESSKAAVDHDEDAEEDGDEEDMASQQTVAKIKEEAQADKSSGQDTAHPADEPRRVLRGAGKKPTQNRQLNSKNFLKMVLPNITRLSRTEIIQDLRVMEAYAKIHQRV
mmetsp:Transcript_16098/g.44861  ORF Transcript_16098/g.44861 Transcript_16098/m.44861 type:complete len:246 (+) Transcript_16098:218-955(+)|eukprot:CAMPEP_0117673462 /NCGR_PEP_ID=MMETSP0804-20121206/14489_1 /TAXON_ID=1074897 /ORGANISM="Tetraselmis astigmatica, Strain CCMP880" /LENGTH=245 /DNA_ID=CAMNT_0005482209 /DNA_START=111 /DNA_END=848 /DNA_ORIENTATION=-